MVANDNLATEFGIVSSYLAFIMIYRSLDFIFKDSNLIFEIDWDAKNRIPIKTMKTWDIRSSKYAQNTMALKRFDKDSFAHIYGTRTKKAW